jgi:hypothetical protein
VTASSASCSSARVSPHFGHLQRRGMDLERMRYLNLDILSLLHGGYSPCIRDQRKGIPRDFEARQAGEEIVAGTDDGMAGELELCVGVKDTDPDVAALERWEIENRFGEIEFARDLLQLRGGELTRSARVDDRELVTLEPGGREDVEDCERKATCRHGEGCGDTDWAPLGLSADPRGLE